MSPRDCGRHSIIFGFLTTRSTHSSRGEASRGSGTSLTHTGRYRTTSHKRSFRKSRGSSRRAVPFGEDAVSEVKAMLDEHAAGRGLKKDEDALALTWKGHNVAFATARLPA
ncbi:hypothetical protein NL676_039793 [Syzygium grande]|nr:hypothetical protein NL676_039793 [Syzygium grande]